MAFPTTSVLDDFNRANSNLGAPNWTQGVYETGQSNLAIGAATANAVSSDGAGATVRAHAYWSATTFGPDAEAYVDILTLGTQTIGVFLRMQQTGSATADGYTVRRDIGGAAFEVDRIDNGVLTTLGATFAGTGLASGDSLGASIVGNTITVYRKPAAGAWAAEGTRTDSTYSAAGHIGAEVWASSVLDNFGGGTVVTATAATPARPLLSPGLQHPQTFQRRLYVPPPAPAQAAATVFNDSGSGTITLSGTATESQTHTSAASGTITLSGTFTQSQSHTSSGTGTITLSGTRTESLAATESRSGTISLSGARTESAAHTAAAAGTISLAGSQAQSQTHTATGSGSIVLSGTATENFVPPGAVTAVNERMLLRVGV